MRARAALVLVVAFATGCTSGGSAGSSAPAFTVPPQHVQDLAWLSGTWRSTEGETVQEECWTAPMGGTMFGIGRTVIGGRTRFFENLRIEERPDGLVYVASPLGRGETAFELRAGGPQRARFENPEHDWPTSIEYALQPDGRLTATVSGPERTEEYVWTRHGG